MARFFHCVMEGAYLQVLCDAQLLNEVPLAAIQC